MKLMTCLSYPLISLSIFLLTALPTLRAQTLSDYFSQEGLSLSSYHVNFFDGNRNMSHTFYKKDIRCGHEVLVFLHNTKGSELLLSIEGEKLYRYYNDITCYRELIFDFGLEVGDIITGGMYDGSTVESKFTFTLANGETRPAIKLTHGGLYDDTIVEGIGDIHRGLLPTPDFEGYDVFVCARLGDQLLLEDPIEGWQCDDLSCAQPVEKVSASITGFQMTTENNTVFASDYLWDFGDGQTSTELAPTHVYATPGCYTVSFSANNQCTTGELMHVANIPVCVGEPWKVDYVIDTAFSLNISRFSDELEFIYYNDQLYRTANNGTNWTHLPIPAPPQGVRRVITALKMFDPQNGIFVCGHYQGQSDLSAIFVTHNGGNTWEAKEPGSYFLTRLEVASDGRAWIGGGGMYRSFDYGDTWEHLNFPDFEIYDIQHIGDNMLVGIGYDDIQPDGDYLLLKSHNNGTTWDTTYVPEEVREWHFFDELTGYGYRPDFGLSKTIDGGISWTPVALPFTPDSYGFHSFDTAWIVDDINLIHYTTDGMQTFTKSSCGDVPIYEVSAISGTEAYAICRPAGSGTNGGQFKKSFGETQEIDCTTDTDGDGYEDFFDCDAENPDIYPGAMDIPDNGIDEDCDGQDLISGVHQLAENSILIYPNPARDFLEIRSEKEMDLLVYLFDSHMKMILTTANPDGKINLPDLSAGIYFLKVTDRQSHLSIVDRIVVMK